MRIFTKSLLALALTIVCVGVAKAQDPGKKIYEKDWTSAGSYDMWNQGFTTGEPPVAVEGKSIGIVSSALQVVNGAETTENYNLQYFVGDGVPIKKGANYVVRIGIKGSEAGSLTCVLGGWSDTRNTSLAFTTTASDVDVTLKDMPVTLADAHVMLQSGKYVGTLTITKVQVFELESVNTYGDAIGSKDFTSAGDQSIYWKSDTAPDPTYSEENGLTMTAESASTNFWDYQYNIAQADTEIGKDYIIHLNVKGTEGGNIHWSFGNHPYTVSGSFEVTDAWNTIELTCIGVPYTGASDLAIQTGDYVATLYVKDVTIYPAVEGRLVEVGDAGYSTFSAYKAVKMRGVTAYAAKYSGGNIVLTPVTEVPAGAGVIIEAAKGTYKVPVIESASEIDAINGLQVSNGSVEGDGSIYALGKKDDKVGFMKVKSGVAVPAGKAYIVIAGGADAFASVPYSGFLALHALDSNPCSPFNKCSGITLGEGSGAVIVESYEHALKRNAKVYCEVLGSGVSSDAHHITAPREDGEGQQMQG